MSIDADKKLFSSKMGQSCVSPLKWSRQKWRRLTFRASPFCVSGGAYLKKTRKICYSFWHLAFGKNESIFISNKVWRKIPSNLLLICIYEDWVSLLFFGGGRRLRAEIVYRFSLEALLKPPCFTTGSFCLSGRNKRVPDYPCPPRGEDYYCEIENANFSQKLRQRNPLYHWNSSGEIC